MLIENDLKIINVEELTPQVLQLQFSLDWTMEDSAMLAEHIVTMLSAKVVEVVQGADLYCLRISLGVNEFLLNFEEYSHACWLECATDQDITALQVIKQTLEVN